MTCPATPLDPGGTPISYLVAFDNTGGLSTGVALVNISAAAESIPVTLRDDHGTIVGNDTIQLPAGAHTSYVFTDRTPAAANIRGTVEFSVSGIGPFSILGLRGTSGQVLTTIPVLRK